MLQNNINIKTGGNGEYFYLDYYIPKNKKIAPNQGKLPQSVKYSDLILKYKKGDSKAIAFYIKILNNIIYNYFYFYDLILPVPPSNSYLDVYPNSQVCLYLAALGTIATYEKAVVCTKGHKPGHIENNIELKKMDLNNISFEYKYNYKSKKIIIFDDIITTGTTFKLIKNALLKEGASAVTGIFLGKTPTEEDIINFTGRDI
ncbi:MAG: hypothetical protein M1584_06155 [Deltaproteobacteria bacterium]|jgi:ATP-dependent DNA helicase RecQ|nr:hypothetical protein [Deltaproteobacteria bacterium]MCL6120606.1 hypothetical protein [Deltaproteobacteria bacterium]